MRLKFRGQWFEINNFDLKIMLYFFRWSPQCWIKSKTEVSHNKSTFTSNQHLPTEMLTQRTNHQLSILKVNLCRPNKALFINQVVSKLTLWFQSESDCSGLFSVFPLLGLFISNDDGLIVHLVQSVAQYLVKPQEQVPVVVRHKQRVRLILKSIIWFEIWNF